MGVLHVSSPCLQQQTKDFYVYLYTTPTFSAAESEIRQVGLVDVSLSFYLLKLNKFHTMDKYILQLFI